MPEKFGHVAFLQHKLVDLYGIFKKIITTIKIEILGNCGCKLNQNSCGYAILRFTFNSIVGVIQISASRYG